MEKINAFWISFGLVAVTGLLTLRYLIRDEKNGLWSGSTAEEVAERFDVDEERIAFVTGCSVGGIGFETARVLALHGFKVIMHFRTQAKADAALNTLGFEQDNVLETILFDLSDLTQVAEAGYELSKRHQRIDLLILNAGMFQTGKKSLLKTVDGFEKNLAVNHLSQCLLIETLRPSLKQSLDARIIILTSEMHVIANGLFEKEWFNESNFEPMMAYAETKLSLILLAIEYNKIFEQSKQKIKVVSVHPGHVRTNMVAAVKKSENDLNWFVSIVSSCFEAFMDKFVTKSIEQGASTTIYCALTPKLIGGWYYANTHEQNLIGFDVFGFRFPGLPANRLLTDETAPSRWLIKTKTLIQPFLDKIPFQ